MPGGNGTGPMGMGPMTGRAAGFCAGYGVPGYQNPIGGRGGMGTGRGFGGGRGLGGGGRGWRNQFYATGLTGWQRAAGGFAPTGYAGAPTAPSADQQLAMLKSQAEYAESQLTEIRKRIDELETKSE